MTAIEDETADTPADDPKSRVPGGADIWYFVIFESLVFTSYLCVYLYFRAQHPREFLRSQSELSLPLGIVATILLLTSSWSIARCVERSRAGRHRDARRLGLVTAGLGVAFLALKIAEWVRLIHAGHTFTSGDFTQYYFFLTGLHALHLLIGFVALGVLIRQLSVAQQCSQQTVETCATYWHTVDLFWVLIFALLYIVR